MKNFYWLLGSFFWSVYAQAAVVSLGTPPASALDPATYEVGGQLYSVFDNIDSDPAFGSNASGEELIWLGVHESWASSDPASIAVTGVDSASRIDVNVTNDNGSATTQGVSLVLSSAFQIDWFVNVDASVQLNNIFIISLGEIDEAHRVRVNDAQSNFLPGGSAMLGGVNVLRSNTTDDCGYELPTSDPAQGCNTEVTLGLAENAEFELQSVLANMQVANGTDLQLTSFNGSYYVNQFDVIIDTVIPLPASALLFASALFTLAGLRKYAGAAPQITS